MTDLVVSDVVDNVGIIRLNDPDNRNRLSEAMLDAIPELVSRHERDPNVGLIRLELPGCAGADLKGILACANETAVRKLFGKFRRAMLALAQAKKFVTCLVTGNCFGGALGLIAACDYVAVRQGVLLGLTEINFRFGPHLIGAMVIHRIGDSNYADLALNGTLVLATDPLVRSLWKIEDIGSKGAARLLSIWEQDRLDTAGGRALAAIKQTRWGRVITRIEQESEEGVSRSARICWQPDVQECLRAFDEDKRDPDSSNFQRGFAAA